MPAQNNEVENAAKIRSFARKGRHNKAIPVKYGVKLYATCLLSRAKFDPMGEGDGRRSH